MAAGKQYLVISLFVFFLITVCCLPEPGKKDLYFNKVSQICFRCLNAVTEYCIFLSVNYAGDSLLLAYFFLHVDPVLCMRLS